MCPKDIVLEYDDNTVFLEDGTKWTLKCNITDNDSAGNATFVNIAVYKGNSTDIKFVHLIYFKEALWSRWLFYILLDSISFYFLIKQSWLPQGVALKEISETKFLKLSLVIMAQYIVTPHGIKPQDYDKHRWIALQKESMFNNKSAGMIWFWHQFSWKKLNWTMLLVKCSGMSVHYPCAHIKVSYLTHW